MLVVGLTGGVGSGKSTVADLLAKRSIEIIDADVIARDVVAKGTDGLAAISDRFGSTVLHPDGILDRHKLAEIVFSDAEERLALEAIVHPRVRAEIARQLDSLRGSEVVVALVVPLLIESGHYTVDRLVVVDCNENVAVQRVMHDRGWTELHARQRIASQMARDDRLATADYVIDNNGSLDHLSDRVDAFMRWLNS